MLKCTYVRIFWIPYLHCTCDISLSIFVILDKSLDGGRGLHISNGSADFRKLVMLLYESILHHDYNLTEKIMEAVCKWPFQGGELPLKVLYDNTFTR